MSFSTSYRAIRSQLRTDLASVLGIASTAIHNGPPETEETGSHAVITSGRLESAYDHAVASGNKPGMTIEINVDAFITYPASSVVLEDAALDKADALCALIEAGASYSDGMFPLLSAFEVGELTGIVEGTGNAQLHLQFTLSFMVQRARG